MKINEENLRNMKHKDESNMQLVAIENGNDVLTQMDFIGVTARGKAIMLEKFLFRVVHVTHVDTRAANIIKQSMLSQGGEAAVSAGTINLAEPYTDILLAGTLHQYRNLIVRLKEQYWGSKEIAQKLEKLLWEEK